MEHQKILRKIKIGGIQKREEKEEKQEKIEKRKKAEMLKSFKKHGICPDYKPDECDTKLGVYACWDTEKHRKFRCPVLNYEN